MAARLFCKTGDLTGSSFVIEAEALIGSSSDSEIRLEAEGIKGTHARIYLDQATGGYVVEELAGQGLLVDNMAVTGVFRLEQLHVITLGDGHDFVFQVMADSWAADQTKPTAPWWTEGEK